MIHYLNIQIPDSFQLPTEQYRGRGKHCFVVRATDEVREKFGLLHKKLLLKVFHLDPIDEGTDISKIKWGDDPKGDNPRLNTTIMEATKIQNICHFEYVAPKVHALLTVIFREKLYLAQLIDDLGADFKEHHTDSYAVYERIKELGAKYGFTNQKDDVSKWDVLQDKLIDFQTFWFTEEHKKKIVQIYKDKTKWGKIYYHECPALELTGGPRNMAKRVIEMGLDKVDFKDKTVLDIGCSGGIFINYALDRGAKRAVGLDFKECVQGARLASNESEHFNAEYYGIDLLKTNTKYLQGLMNIDKFDIVLYFSMFRHVHFPDFVWELCGDMAIIEWNNWKSEEEIKGLVGKQFNINKEGRTTDHGTGKPFWFCKPK